MKTITQYQEDIKALMKKSVDIDAQCVTENREPTSAELVLKNEILDTVQEYQDIVKTMERQERMANALELPDPAATVPTPAPGTHIELREKDRFNSLGEQLAAVMRAGLPNQVIDPRLHNIQATASGLNETVPSDGGFLVQTDFATKMLADVFDTGILASRCDRVPISGTANSIKINGVDETSRASTRYGGIVSYWQEEASTKTASAPKFRQIELNLKKMIGLCYATDELMNDAAALEAIIRDGFRGEFGFRVDDAIINGTGAGQPLGILNAGSLVSQAAETGQDADTILAENLVKMYSRRFVRNTADYAWFYNQDCEPQLFTMSLAVGTGGIPVYMPPGGLNNAPHASILGRPAIAIEQCATVGTVGDIILADFKNGYILAEKGGMEAAMSIHVRFIYDEQVFRFVLRVDGQPVRASALTPYKGGAGKTQNHFIALASR